ALLYSLGVFSSASTDNATTNNEEGMVEYSQQWITQLEVHSQVLRLAGVIQGLAQSTSEDQVAFELIIKDLVSGLYLMTLMEQAVGKVQCIIETEGPPLMLATLLIQNADKCDG
ncbi:hypothetical protein IWQ61_006909, partial [Dispira simplex]